MKVSNTTSQDTTVIFLNNKLGSGIKKEVVANSDPNFADIEQINEPVDQVYLIGGNFDKKNYASGKKKRRLAYLVLFISIIITIGSFMK